MLLATGSAFELVKFIQIFCWIVLPVSILAIILTIFFHYWKKRKENGKTAIEEEKFMKASPELVRLYKRRWRIRVIRSFSTDK